MSDAEIKRYIDLKIDILKREIREEMKSLILKIENEIQAAVSNTQPGN